MKQEEKNYVDRNLKPGWFARTLQDPVIPEGSNGVHSVAYRMAYGRLIQILGVYGTYVSFIVVPEEGRRTPTDVYSYHVENLCDFRDEFNVTVYKLIRDEKEKLEREKNWLEVIFKLRRIYRDTP